MKIFIKYRISIIGGYLCRSFRLLNLSKAKPSLVLEAPDYELIVKVATKILEEIISVGISTGNQSYQG